MHRRVFTTAVRLLGLTACLSQVVSCGTTPETSTYHLVWADEFDVDGPPDPESWGFEEGFVRNREAQWFQPQNAFCEGGFLIIEAREEVVRNPSHDPTSDDWRRNRPEARYTSASITTEGKHSWTLGRFEFRARIDTRPGLWPVIWTLGTAREWPGCGEIDLMEFYGGHLRANACWGSAERWIPVWDQQATPIEEFRDPRWSHEFHVWRMDWDEESIRLFVDDELLNVIDLREATNADAEGANPFHEPHYLLVTLALGGTNGGVLTDTEFPARLEVDYIRVYRQTP